MLKTLEIIGEYSFNGRVFTVELTDMGEPDWNSIGDGPTREAVLSWLVGGNVPEPYVEPAPLINPIIPAYMFRDRFTLPELTAVNGLAYSGDVTAQLLLLKVSTATDGIDLTSQTVIDGVAYMVANNVVTAERASEILTP